MGTGNGQKHLLVVHTVLLVVVLVCMLYVTYFVYHLSAEVSKAMQIMQLY